MSSQPTASVIIIGNEILSGKTQDLNLRFLGQRLAKLGIRLDRAEVIRDDAQTIIDCVNQHRRRYDYVFTTGGIGPTHDDITVECVARAFGEGLVEDPEAVRRMTRDHQDELTPARRKMAMFPESATLIDNPISRAPGFSVDNVFVLAGIPSIAQAMFESLAGMLRGGPSIHSRSVDAHLSEGALAPGLGELAEASPDVEIGSYPFFRDDRYGVNVVVRSTDLARVETVIGSVTALMRDLGGDPRPGG